MPKARKTTTLVRLETLPVDDRYNFSYMYRLLHEMRKCIHDAHFKNTMHRFRMSKVIPKMEELLNELCTQSERY